MHQIWQGVKLPTLEGSPWSEDRGATANNCPLYSVQQLNFTFKAGPRERVENLKCNKALAPEKFNGSRKIDAVPAGGVVVVRGDTAR